MKIEDYEWISKLPLDWMLKSSSESSAALAFQTRFPSYQVVYQEINSQFIKGVLSLYEGSAFYNYRIYKKRYNEFVFDFHPEINCVWFDVWPESKNFKTYRD